LGPGLHTTGVVITSNDTAGQSVTLPVVLTCVGDCNADDHAVTVSEILTMVDVALGNNAVSDCWPGDANDDGQITIDEILTAVNNALNGCG